MYYENNYFCEGPETLDNGLKSAYKYAATIDAYPDNNAPGYVVAEVFLTKHNDIVISWHDNRERMNVTVLNLINDAVKRLREMDAN